MFWILAVSRLVTPSPTLWPVCISLSHDHVSSLDDLYRVSFGIESIQNDFEIVEAMELRTCNRVEVYATSRRQLNADEIREKVSHIPVNVYLGRDCVRHCLGVVVGVKSLLPGDPHIKHQCVCSLQRTYTSRISSGRLLHRMWNDVFRISKRYRTTHDGLMLRVKHVCQQYDCGIVVIGAGQLGRHVHDRMKDTNKIHMNRSPVTGTQPLAHLPRLGSDKLIIVCAPVSTEELLASHSRHIVDLTVPSCTVDLPEHISVERLEDWTENTVPFQWNTDEDADVVWEAMLHRTSRQHQIVRMPS